MIKSFLIQYNYFLYLFDNYIKLKVLDKIIYNNNIYEILSIVDNRIYFNTPIIVNNINLSNTFISFYLFVVDDKA